MKHVSIFRFGFIACLFLLPSATASAQQGLVFKTNLTDLLVGRHSVGVEVGLNAPLSIGCDVDVVSRHLFLESNHPWYLGQMAQKSGVIVEPQVRWYPAGEALRGGYLSFSGFFGYAAYKLDHPETHPLGTPTWRATGGSVHLGRQFAIGRFVVDGYVGGTLASSSSLGIFTEDLPLFPPPSGLRLSGGLRFGFKSMDRP